MKIFAEPACLRSQQPNQTKPNLLLDEIDSDKMENEFSCKTATTMISRRKGNTTIKQCKCWGKYIRQKIQQQFIESAGRTWILVQNNMIVKKEEGTKFKEQQVEDGDNLIKQFRKPWLLKS